MKSFISFWADEICSLILFISSSSPVLKAIVNWSSNSFNFFCFSSSSSRASSSSHCLDSISFLRSISFLKASVSFSRFSIYSSLCLANISAISFWESITEFLRSSIWSFMSGISLNNKSVYFSMVEINPSILSISFSCFLPSVILLAFWINLSIIDS